jgi:hypothetical protein
MKRVEMGEEEGKKSGFTKLKFCLIVSNYSLYFPFEHIELILV